MSNGIELTEEQKFWLAAASGVPIKFNPDPQNPGEIKMTTENPVGVKVDEKNGRIIVGIWGG